MSNKRNRVLALLLAVFMVCSMALTGCGQTPTETQPQETKPQQQAEETSLTQEFSYQADKYLATGGKTDYVIVQENTQEEVSVHASEELRKLFAEATGCTMDIYVDGSQIPEGKKVISLGKTGYAEEAGLSGQALTAESFRIVTENDNIYILGQSSHAVLWGVYKLMDLLFGYEFFKADCYSLESKTELNMISADWTEEPDIAYTPGYHGLANFGTGIKALRYRNRPVEDIATGGTDGNFHNSLVILDATVYNNPEKPETYHPNWYSTTADQLCYTARGDAAELEAMVETVADYFVKKLAEEPNATYVMFQIMDNRSWCGCSACVAMEAKYGAKSTSVLIMSKMLHTSLQQKLKDAGDERTIYVSPMLYNAIEDVPVVKDETTGQYRLTDPSLDFSGVVPLWAAMSAKVHAKPWQDEANAAAVELLNKLNCAFESFWIWDYAVDFRDYFVPYNIFDNLGEDFRFLQNYNISLHLYQLDHMGSNCSSFGALKAYLLSQLMWDADQDTELLTDRFFQNVYGSGAEAMQEMYEAWLNLWEYNTVQHGEVLPWDTGIYSTAMLKAEYYPRGVLREWLGLIDEAYEAIEPLKATDPSRHAIYEYNIKMESIFVRYLYAVLYLTANNEENLAFKLELYHDVANNFYMVSEGGTTWDFAVSLGVDGLLA